MKNGFNAIIKAAKVGGIKTALVVGGAIGLVVVISKFASSDDDSEGLEEVVDICAEEVAVGDDTQVSE